MGTKFEEIGVDRQYGASNYWQAVKQLEISCELCCRYGMNIKCDRCQIQEAHNFVKECRFQKQAARVSEENEEEA